MRSVAPSEISPAIRCPRILKLHQLVASVSMLLVALLSGAALREHARSRFETSQRRAFRCRLPQSSSCVRSRFFGKRRAARTTTRRWRSRRPQLSTRGRADVARSHACSCAALSSSSRRARCSRRRSCSQSSALRLHAASPDVGSRWIRITRVLLAGAAVALVAAMLPVLVRVTQMFNPSHALFMSMHSPEAIPRTLALCSRRARCVVRREHRPCGSRAPRGSSQSPRARWVMEKVLPRFLLATYGFYVFFAGVSNAWYLLPLLSFVPFAGCALVSCGPRDVRVHAAFAMRPTSDFSAGMPSSWVLWAVVSGDARCDRVWRSHRTSCSRSRRRCCE